jgi:hypothetical protein
MQKPSSTWLLLVLVAAAVLPAVAQQAAKRTVLGQVLDENEKVVASAIVHLKKLGSGEEWSVVTDKEGRYQFNNVDMKTDHEVYAEQGDRRSRTRTISQFDTRTRVTVNLQLQKKEEEKKAAP